MSLLNLEFAHANIAPFGLKLLQLRQNVVGPKLVLRLPARSVLTSTMAQFTTSTIAQCLAIPLAPRHWLWWILWFLAEFEHKPMPAIAGVDGFAGSKTMAKAFWEAGLPLIPFELMDDPVQQNCLSLEGQQFFLQTLVRASLTPYGICWLGPPCSWWVWVSRSVHQRSRNNPLGNVSHPSVAFHNQVAEFVANVVWTCAALGLFYVLEQPLSSVLVHHPHVSAALRDTKAVRVSFPLHKFGANTQKYLQLWGTAPWLPELRRVAGIVRGPVAHAVLCTIGDRGQVTGKKDDMVASAAYPTTFCDVVAILHKGFLASQAIQAQAVRMFVKSLPQLRHTWFWEALVAFLFPPPLAHSNLLQANLL